jgi:hypothetical protein
VSNDAPSAAFGGDHLAGEASIAAGVGDPGGAGPTGEGGRGREHRLAVRRERRQRSRSHVDPGVVEVVVRHAAGAVGRVLDEQHAGPRAGVVDRGDGVRRVVEADAVAGRVAIARKGPALGVLDLDEARDRGRREPHVPLQRAQPAGVASHRVLQHLGSARVHEQDGRRVRDGAGEPVHDHLIRREGPRGSEVPVLIGLVPRRQVVDLLGSVEQRVRRPDAAVVPDDAHVPVVGDGAPPTAPRQREHESREVPHLPFLVSSAARRAACRT